MKGLRSLVGIALAVSVAAFGCDSGTGVSDANMDGTGGDTTRPDVRQDPVQPDTGEDAGPDVPADLPEDTQPDVQEDVAPDVKPDVPPDVQPDVVDMVDLIATDIQGDTAGCNPACTNTLCSGGSCVACNDRGDDANCATQYGAGFICQGGVCIQGDCHDTSDCVAQDQVCRDLTCQTCRDGTDNALCGADQICRNGQCQVGCDSTTPCSGGRFCDLPALTCRDCLTSADCPNGGTCDVGSTFTCSACTTDGQCTAAAPAGYGANHLCIGGGCLTGNCRADADCSSGQICDSGTRSCRDCVDTTEDARCGQGSACISGRCRAGACHVDSQCSAPNTCQASNSCGCSTSATCGGGVCLLGSCAPCTVDTQCTAAPPLGYGPDHLCIAGACIPGTCRTDGECGSGEICCNNSCTSNDCCGDSDDARCDAQQLGLVCNAQGQCVCPDRPAGTVDVDASNGNDVTGNGSSACPFRSITRGLQVATSDTMVRVAAGTYSTAGTGETFPLTVSPDDIFLVGAGPTTTNIRDSSAGALLNLLGSTEVFGFTIQNTGTGNGINIASSSLIISTFVTGGGSCVRTNAGTNATLALVTTQGCLTGIDHANGLLDVTSATVRQNTTGITVGPGARLQASDVTVTASTGNGIVFADAAPNTVASNLEGCQVNGNRGDGMRVTLNSNVRVRRSSFQGNTGSGIVAVGASVQLDLGSNADGGRNILNSSTDPNGGVGICNQTGFTLNAPSNTWRSCPPSTNAGCSAGRDFNTGVSAANCTAQ